MARPRAGGHCDCSASGGAAIQHTESSSEPHQTSYPPTLPLPPRDALAGYPLVSTFNNTVRWPQPATAGLDCLLAAGAGLRVLLSSRRSTAGACTPPAPARRRPGTTPRGSLARSPCGARAARLPTASPPPAATARPRAPSCPLVRASGRSFLDPSGWAVSVSASRKWGCWVINRWGADARGRRAGAPPQLSAACPPYHPTSPPCRDQRREDQRNLLVSHTGGAPGRTALPPPLPAGAGLPRPPPPPQPPSRPPDVPPPALSAHRLCPAHRSCPLYTTKKTFVLPMEATCGPKSKADLKPDTIIANGA